MSCREFRHRRIVVCIAGAGNENGAKATPSAEPIVFIGLR